MNYFETFKCPNILGMKQQQHHYQLPFAQPTTGVVLLASIAFLLTSLVGFSARADEPKLIGIFFNPGLSTGITDQDGARFFLGGEASIAKVEENKIIRWCGGYVDALWIAGTNGIRHSVGGEFGLTVIGVELGYLGELYKGNYSAGIRTGLVATIGVVGAYFRYGHLWGNPAQNNYAEGGILLKIPFDL